ncbi:hypothetical protein BDN72DRAFT_841109 [Pluteus cervinus]|uniref:Uncharacterized protein n=1 Tax=Pluteus cervinus TaxID=181527 RepID=A0ACD3ATH4_9AGAR|nr:hypothetical protein BDN72DRAFT_841109 [Pluteus cervinus]
MAMKVESMTGTCEPATPSQAPGTSSRPTHHLLTLESFFSEYTLFTYIPTNHPSDEFARLVSENQWSKKGEKYKQAKEEYDLALVIEFGKIYGSDERSWDSWRTLCEVLGVEEVPGSVTACKKIVRNTHVNLADLVATFATGQPVEIFPDRRALKVYTRRTKKIFPKATAKSSSLLKCLLRRMF